MGRKNTMIDRITKAKNRELIKIFIGGLASLALTLYSTTLILLTPVHATTTETKIAQPSESNQQNSTNNTAETVWYEGYEFYQQSTVESLREAITKFETTLSIYKTTGNIEKQAYTLFYLGIVYRSLRENKKAIS